MRVAAHVVGVEADRLEQLDDARLVLGARSWRACGSISASPTIAPTVMRGLSDAYGSWKMICMSRASARSSSLPARVTSLPSNQTSPEVGSIRRRMQRPVVLLPQPDSPTRPSVSPAVEVEAHAVDRVHAGRPRGRASPPVIGKCLTRSLTCSSGAVATSRRAHASASRRSAGCRRCSAPCGPGDRLAQRRRRRDALGDRVLAARREAAALGRVDQLGHRAGDLPRAAPCAAPPCRCAGSSGSAPACRDGAGARTARLDASPPRRPCRRTSRRRAARSRRRRPSRA